jgi:hypothetical protein
MSTAIDPVKKLPLTGIIIGAITIAVLAAALIYLNRPAPAVSEESATAEAKAYLSNLQLGDVTMQASTNFMNQQVVEIQGKIANNGPRKLSLIEVFCVFYGLDGKEIHRERLAIAHTLAPSETRTFRLPFDSLPDGWNQAMPRMAIAKITFAS